LVALGEKSLLRLTPAGRYQVHELLRQFAAEKLQAVPEEKEATQNRHRAYYLAYLQQREEALKGKQQQAALAEIGEEIGNVQAAWNWAVAQDKVEVIDQALESLYEFYSIRSRFQEGQAAFGRAAARLQTQARPESEIVLTKTLARQGALVSGSLYEAAEELLQQSLTMARQLGLRSEMAFCLNFLGRLMIFWGDVTEAERLVQESLMINRELGDPAGIALSLVYLGKSFERRGENLKAEQVYQDGLTIARKIGRQDRIADFLDRLGWVNWTQG
jgi:tetratricopeptide (TPR) repeat protein